jgi:rod shape-determining protein MreD
MTRAVLVITVALLFFLEGTVLQFLVPVHWGLSIETVPRFALVGTILIALFLGRREGLYFGLSIGFCQDVAFNHIIGVHALSMMVAGYFAGLIPVVFHRSLAVVSASLALVLFGHEWFLYSLYRLFDTPTTDVQWMLTKQIFPSVGLNALFGLMIYRPMRKLCEAVQDKKGFQIE